MREVLGSIAETRQYLSAGNPGTAGEPAGPMRHSLSLQGVGARLEELEDVDQASSCSISYSCPGANPVLLPGGTAACTVPGTRQLQTLGEPIMFLGKRPVASLAPRSSGDRLHHSSRRYEDPSAISPSVPVSGVGVGRVIPDDRLKGIHHSRLASLSASDVSGLANVVGSGEPVAIVTGAAGENGGASVPCLPFGHLTISTSPATSGHLVVGKYTTASLSGHLSSIHLETSTSTSLVSGDSGRRQPSYNTPSANHNATTVIAAINTSKSQGDSHQTEIVRTTTDAIATQINPAKAAATPMPQHSGRMTAKAKRGPLASTYNLALGARLLSSHLFLFLLIMGENSEIGWLFVCMATTPSPGMKSAF
ncbi:unnamed protein product [Protopolystoma xenopodis]|uniref:Uncharacterized protein n=1 Tax=Protopolystoma xenopodis TaxID=117903 RepID=A0A448WDG7_9PLAT|nr:unnamed protein product [Protopolystoma xenopodis]